MYYFHLFNINSELQSIHDTLDVLISYDSFKNRINMKYNIFMSSIRITSYLCR